MGPGRRRSSAKSPWLQGGFLLSCEFGYCHAGTPGTCLLQRRCPHLPLWELPGTGFSANQLERQANSISKNIAVLLGSWDSFQMGCHSIPVLPRTGKTRLSPQRPRLSRE